MAKKLKKEKVDTTAVHADVLRSLTSQANSLEAEMAETRGELGAIVKSAEKTHGLHRQVFALVRRLFRMESDKRAVFLRSLDDYRMKLNLDDQPDLFDDGPAVPGVAPGEETPAVTH